MPCTNMRSMTFTSERERERERGKPNRKLHEIVETKTKKQNSRKKSWENESLAEKAENKQTKI